MNSQAIRRLPLAASFLLLALLAASARADVVINEVLSAPGRDWNGDGEVDFKNDEWVEILNSGPAAAALDDLYLRDASGETYHFGFSGVLASGAVLIVYGHQAVAWQAANDAGSSGLSLNNGGDSLELWRDQASPRVLEAVDAITIPAHTAATDRALGRNPGVLDWGLFDALNPYAGELLPTGSGCEPTPGAVNHCASVSLGDQSWGNLKSEHRP